MLLQPLQARRLADPPGSLRSPVPPEGRTDDGDCEEDLCRVIGGQADDAVGDLGLDEPLACDEYI